MLRKTIYLISWLIISVNTYAQDNLSLRIPLGINWRSTTMNLTNLDGVKYNYRIPFVGEWNTQVFSINCGIQLYSENYNMAIEYVPNLRYNYVHNGTDDSISTQISSKHGTYEFIVDHQFRVLKFFSRDNSKEKRSKYIFLGYAINNAGKKVFVRSFQTFKDGWVDLDYSTFSIGAGFPVWKGVYFEPSVNYIPKNFPNNKVDELLTFSFALRYTINVLDF
jgi:hypothetical protein